MHKYVHTDIQPLSGPLWVQAVLDPHRSHHRFSMCANVSLLASACMYWYDNNGYALHRCACLEPCPGEFTDVSESRRLGPYPSGCSVENSLLTSSKYQSCVQTLILSNKKKSLLGMAGNEKCPHLYVTARKMGFSLLALDKHSSLSEVSWGAVG